ncbi:MAG: SDR family oxidoreductase [Planctomycetaceae bacterium]|nr:SDR family oxidoreductase [Planctomycetaceae bacterium]
MSKLVIGCGYLGRRVAERWARAGERVFAVTRSPQRAVALRQQGLEPVVADVTDRASLAGLPEAETVLYAVGFDRTADKPKRDVYVAGLANVLDALSPRVARLIYISSTSVYGQQAGEWVDEQSSCEPATEDGRICLAAEQILATHPLGDRGCILRLAGLYGPGRVPRREALAAGAPLAARPDSYLNLIHVDDAASAAIATAGQPTPAALYLVTDGEPVLRREYYRELARRWQLPEPRFADAAAGTPAAGRGATNKRISNRRLLTDLKLDLKYPSYRAGLAAILAWEEA